MEKLLLLQTNIKEKRNNHMLGVYRYPEVTKEGDDNPNLNLNLHGDTYIGRTELEISVPTITTQIDGINRIVVLLGNKTYVFRGFATDQTVATKFAVSTNDSQQTLYFDKAYARTSKQASVLDGGQVVVLSGLVGVPEVDIDSKFYPQHLPGVGEILLDDTITSRCKDFYMMIGTGPYTYAMVVYSGVSAPYTVYGYYEKDLPGWHPAILDKKKQDVTDIDENMFVTFAAASDTTVIRLKS